MRLIDRLRTAPAGKQVERGQMGNWSWPTGTFAFGGHQYPLGLNQTLTGRKAETVSNDFAGYMAALSQSPPAFAAQMKRARYLSQARFKFRSLSTKVLFGSPALSVLEKPWPSGTTGELISKMEWHEGLAGNAYVVNRGGSLRVLRPDWVAIIVGSQTDADNPADQIDAEVIGYVYTPGGIGLGGRPQILLPSEIAHWSPLPDPTAQFRGMSWMTPAIRDIQGDVATADHKLRYFENGATPNLVVKGIPAANKAEFDEVVKMMEGQHSGLANAYKTLYLTAGADATVVGSDLSQVAFKAVQGAGETRIAVVGEVPASLLGISEGMQGSSLNAGNYAESRRLFADGWLSSTWQSLSACLARLVQVPAGAELWHDTVDMPLLREDEKDAATIRQADAATIASLTTNGFDADAAVAYVESGDLSNLVGKHNGLPSVQQQKGRSEDLTLAPEINVRVEPAKVSLATSGDLAVNLPPAQRTTRRVERDEHGRIERVYEDPVTEPVERDSGPVTEVSVNDRPAVRTVKQVERDDDGRVTQVIEVQDAD